MIDFMQNLQTEEHNFQENFQHAKHPTNFSLGIPQSKDISGIEVRLSNVKVIDNKTPKVPPFPGLAKVYFVNLVVSDIQSNSISLDLKGFEKIDDGESLSLDRTLFFWKLTPAMQEVPSQIHVFSSLIKSKQPLRDVAKIMESVDKDDKYKEVVNSLNTVLKTASNLSSISGLIFQVAGIVGNYLGKVDDKPLLTWVQSFTDINGDYDKLGETKKNATNKYASMDLSIIVRDKERQQAADASAKAEGIK